MAKKMMIIINPVAGRGGYALNFGEAMRVLSHGGYTPTLFFTENRKDATRFARENASDYDIVTCIGGDGTLSEVLAGLMEVPNPPPIGYIPMGTANDVATTLRLPKNDTVGAVKMILNGEAHPYDVGGFGKDKYFAYIAGFGAFTNVSYSTPQDQKAALGHLAYVLQGMAELPNIEPIHTRVEFDDGTIETDLIYGSMSNSTSVAGIVKFKDSMVSLGDGFSELVLVKDPKDVGGFGDIISSVLSGRFDGDKLIILHTKKARFLFDRPVAWTRDGEDGGMHQEVTLVNYHRPVQMIF
ncbi:MAG: diacylglycerol kinase family lipid kinase [Oscillospiraceae bacterium]|nr:diacylglycerol kinase family lipid kinase [Oscillospiraceae bacterium]